MLENGCVASDKKAVIARKGDLARQLTVWLKLVTREQYVASYGLNVHILQEEITLGLEEWAFMGLAD